MWKATRKGNGIIHTNPAIPYAIVDRRGLGIASSMGFCVTYRGIPFGSVESAKKYAENER